MRAGKLQFQQNSMHGNPWFRLLRHEVEALVKENSGKDGLHRKKLEKELAESPQVCGRLRSESVRRKGRTQCRLRIHVGVMKHTYQGIAHGMGTTMA